MAMYNDVITLCAVTYINDEYCNKVEQLIKRDVFACVKSVMRSEFYAAAQAGFKPEIKFAIADYFDYCDEPKLIYNEVMYDIIRPYRTGIELELICQRSDLNGDG